MATTMTYGEQLRHPHWQKRRLHMLEAARWECTNCGEKDVMLSVHHKHYVKGRMAWEYGDHELVVLCQPCHEEEHAMRDSIRELLVHIDATQALALLRGFHAASDWFDPWIGDMGRDRDPNTYAVGFAAQLLTYLDAPRLQSAMAHAVSLMKPSVEGRLMYESHKSIFDEVL